MRSCTLFTYLISHHFISIVHKNILNLVFYIHGLYFPHPCIKPLKYKFIFQHFSKMALLYSIKSYKFSCLSQPPLCDLVLSIILLLFDVWMLVYFLPRDLKIKCKEVIHQLFSNTKFNISKICLTMHPIKRHIFPMIPWRRLSSSLWWKLFTTTDGM